jgi:hypothetical protein
VLNSVVLTLDKALLPGDELRDALPGVVTDYRDDVSADLAQLNDEVDALADSKIKSKAAKSATKSEEFLTSADAAPDSKTRIKFVRKAESKLRAAEKLLAKAAGGGGGGGNGKCGNALLAAGDSGSFTVDTMPILANRGKAEFYDDGFTSGVLIFLESCDASNSAFKPEVTIRIPDPSERTYFIGFNVSGGKAFVTYRDAAGLAEAVFGDGNLERVVITEYDAVTGVIAGTFAFDDSHVVTDGAFRFTHIK